MAGKAIRDRDVEYQRKEYDGKNNVLEAYGERVTAWTMYEDIFPDLDLRMPVIIANEDESRHIEKMTVRDAVEQAQGRNDMFLGGTSFYNEFVNKKTAKDIYCFIVDMDNVYAGILTEIFSSGWKDAHGKPMPRPTYIVNSGTGLHLYFVLKRPLPRYTRQGLQIDQLYRKLAATETTSWNFLEKSVQWFGQDFRIAGGCGKNGFENTVFRVGDPWDAAELARMLGLYKTEAWKVKDEKTGETKEFKFLYEGDPLPPMGDNKEEGQDDQGEKRHKKSYYRRTGYYLNRRAYESSVERCKSETHEGHRYMSMCALAALAWKCKISEEQLRHDLLSLLPYYNNSDVMRLVKPREIENAIKMYNSRAINTPKETLENWLGWQFKGSKRNGRKRWDHLHQEKFNDARGWPTIDNPCLTNRNNVLQYMRQNGELHGRPQGSGTKKQLVRDWRDAHPNGKKIECERDLHLSRHTVLKWW